LREAGAARWFIASVVALAVVSSLATIVLAWNLAWFVSQVFIEKTPIEGLVLNLAWVLVAGLAKAAVIWVQEFLAQKAAHAVKVELRQKYLLAVTKLGPSWLARNQIAEINNLATTGLDALDAYFAKYLPQLIYTALITPVFIVAITMADFSSGLVVIFTLPLIPLFMVLIGWATRSIQQKQLDALNRLSGHFLEVMRGLTTLRIFNRAENQVKTLELVSNDYRHRTIRVLRVSFLSGFALELLASLSVALIAVSIGLRLVNSEISLLIGLFVLILAPEAYLPIRQVGANFHASAEGVAASSSILQTISEADNSSEKQQNPDLERFEPGKLTVVTGPSGSGKTTLLRGLVGIDAADQQRMALVAWAPQKPLLMAGTVISNITGPESEHPEKLTLACKYAALDDLTAQSVVGPAGQGVSGGQAQRIALARTFYRALTKGTRVLILDEPISAVDSQRAQLVIQALKQFAANGFTVIAASHQSLLIDAADHLVQVSNA
jgi:ATP-binding cassette subfamily C protein CydD